MKYILLIISIHLSIISFSQPNINDTVPDFTVVDTKGNEHHLYNYLNDNKYVCIDFFGISCEQCINLVPIFNAVYHNYGCNKNNFIILAINLANTNAEVAHFEEQYSGVYPVVSGIEGGGGNVYTSWQISYYPQFLLIAPNKTLVAKIDPINEVIIDSVFNNFGIQTDTCFDDYIFDYQIETKIKLYPNPVKNKLFIKAETQRHYKYIIYNILGNIIISGNIDNTNFIDVSSLKNGIFFIELKRKNTSLKKVFIKK